jgi:3-dehydroquinate synthase
VLNLGHTVGHGIESSAGGTLYHGECVALGMLPMCGEAIRDRVIAVLRKCDLYRTPHYDWEAIAKAGFHDKKAEGDGVTVTVVEQIGSFEMKRVRCDGLIAHARTVLEGLAAL